MPALSSTNHFQLGIADSSIGSEGRSLWFSYWPTLGYTAHGGGAPPPFAVVRDPWPLGLRRAACSQPLGGGGQHRLARRGRRSRRTQLRPEGEALDRSVLEGNFCQERSRGSFLIETRMPGEFADGDVRGGSIKRCASAVSEAVMAVRLVHQYPATGGLQYAAGGG